MPNRKSSVRSDRKRELLLEMIRDSPFPLPACTLSKKVESTTNLSCSVYAVSNVLRPLVSKRVLLRRRIRGTNKHGYELAP